MKPDVRLLRVNRRLTAQERAILCVRAGRNYQPEDQTIRGLMPPDQLDEFNWYIALSNTTLNLVPSVVLFQMECLCQLLHYSLRMQSSAADEKVLTREVVPAFRRLWARLLAWEQLRDEIATRFGDPIIVPPIMDNRLRDARELLAGWLAILKSERANLRTPSVDMAALADLRQAVRTQQRLYL